MNPADEMAAKFESNGAVAASNDKLDEQLRVSVEALLHPSPPRKPVEELDDLLLAISHHLDQETSERKAIYGRLTAIESEIKERSSRGLARYLVVICIGVAAILAWLSYGEATRQMIATRVPELGWSPEAKQTIASWMQHLGWTKLPPGPANRPSGPQGARFATPETLAQKAPAVLSLDPKQLQQIAANLAALRQAVERPLADVRETVEQLAASQEQMAREITKLQAADEGILEKIPAPPAHRPAAPARKPMPIARPSSHAPMPPHQPPHP